MTASKNLAIAGFLRFFIIENNVFTEQFKHQRTTLFDPPFADQFTVTVTGPEEASVRHSIELLRQGIGNAAEKPPYDTLGIQVIGPAPAPVVKVNGVYRYRLLVLGQNIAPVRELLAGFMRAFVQRPENRRLHIYTDCDKMD